LACVGWSAVRRYSIRRAYVSNRDVPPGGARPLAQLAEMGVNGSKFHARTGWFFDLSLGCARFKSPLAHQ
jgi:hypothetical protein